MKKERTAFGSCGNLCDTFMSVPGHVQIFDDRVCGSAAADGPNHGSGEQ